VDEGGVVDLTVGSDLVVAGDLLDDVFLDDDPAPLPPGRRRQGSNASEIHRRRLLSSLTRIMAEKGYSATRVADISRGAKVSSRTFYEHFTDKAEAFLAAYVLAGSLLLEQIIRATAVCDTWEDRIVIGFRSYLDALDKHPAVTRLFLFHIPGESEVIRRDKTRNIERWSELLVEQVRQARIEDARMRAVTHELTPTLAYAVVSAVNEMVLHGIEQGVPASSMLGPCLTIFGGAVNEQSHEFARLMGERAGRPALDSLLERARTVLGYAEPTAASGSPGSH
jgi:AcrR family transcriptional regulator